MPDLCINHMVSVPEEELTLRFSRSGGPGGQNVNTRDTRVEVVFDVAASPSLEPFQKARVLTNLAGRLDSEGKLHVVASDSRTQAQNRALAVGRFRSIMEEALRPPPEPRKATKPTRAMHERRLARKRARSRTKQLRRSLPDD